ncbi:rhodanese-like domain-containing protein [Bacteroidaceae bacterium HV4-6-C5C]|jgi:Rhodanese-related sulfurtransferase|nr:rhodanese-like domain-containing protein [Bacteroidaceae bacterium HV4-6-C5C]
MKMNTIITGFCIFFSSLFSCQQNESYKTVSVDEFESVISNPEVQRLDVRTLAEFSDSHIPGSLNINVLDDSFMSMADSLLSKEKPVALYCRSGKRSRKAAGILAEKGYKVYNLDKGFESWTLAGKETVK